MPEVALILGSGLLGSPENRYNLPHFRVHPGNPGQYDFHDPDSLNPWEGEYLRPTCKCLLDKPRRKDLSDRHGFVA